MAPNEAREVAKRYDVALGFAHVTTAAGPRVVEVNAFPKTLAERADDVFDVPAEVLGTSSPNVRRRGPVVVYSHPIIDEYGIEEACKLEVPGQL